MATATEYGPNGFSRSSTLPAARSPDTASTIYPERAIRPLPRNRLKSKLSPEQVSTITYPPEPPPISPNLNFASDTRHTPQPRLTNGDSHHHHHHHQSFDADQHCTCGRDVDSGDEDVEFDDPGYRYPAVCVVNGETVDRTDPRDRRVTDTARGPSKLAEQDSAASSGDGYDSFENASNKKKRKIPLSGAPSVHQSQLSADMANMGISNGQLDGSGDDVNGTSHVKQLGHPAHPASSTVASVSGTGISGAGRGRYGRQETKYRRPLGSSTMNAINGYSSRGSTRASDARHSSEHGAENTGGIISQAIKTAAEQGPLTPASKGKENASLLQSATSPSSAASTKTQFTFFRESESANKMVDQQAITANTPTPTRHGPPMLKGTNSQGMQAPPAPRNYGGGSAAGRPPPPPVTNGVPGAHHPQQAASPPKPKPRRNPAKEYALQAANRKKQQQVQNYHHRPKLENMWICEFCEYEDIYGVPPAAMIRRYEIKDRQERKKAAEKRRLLEKARMKGRKNKKGSGKGGKNGHGSNGAAQPTTPANSQHYDPNLPPPDADEYYDDEDEYGDEYSPVGHAGYDYPQDHYPPPAPIGTPTVPTGVGRGVGGGGGGGLDHA